MSFRDIARHLTQKRPDGTYLYTGLLGETATLTEEEYQDWLKQLDGSEERLRDLVTGVSNNNPLLEALKRNHSNHGDDFMRNGAVGVTIYPPPEPEEEETDG